MKAVSSSFVSAGCPSFYHWFSKNRFVESRAARQHPFTGPEVHASAYAWIPAFCPNVVR